MAPLQKFDPPLGPLASKFSRSKEQTILMKERAFELTSDDFIVKTVEGAEICKIKARLFTNNQNKGVAFVDKNDEEIFRLKNDSFAIKKSWRAEDADGNDLMLVDGEFSSRFHFRAEISLQGNYLQSSQRLGSSQETERAISAEYTKIALLVLYPKSDISFINGADGRRLILKIEGDWWKRDAKITCEGQTVAQLEKSPRKRQLFDAYGTYHLTCAPKVDLVMMAALCLCLDETENKTYNNSDRAG